MNERGRPLALLGSTGYTGGLVCAAARELGLPLRLVGRRRAALEQLARPGDEVRVADGRDPAGLRGAFEGAFAVASCAGPFLEVGPAPLAAALTVGAHYLDTSGEQAFAQLVHERFSDEAERRGVVVFPSFGFDFVPGDLAARLAAEAVGGTEKLDEVIVGYSVQGFAASRGTLRTVGHVTGQPQLAYVDGHLVPSRFGATTRRLRFPFGERTAVEWGGTEPLTVPRHTRVREVRSYFRAPEAAARLAPVGRRAAPLLGLAARVLPAGPSPERRARSRFAVVAEARRGGYGARATLTGADPYGLTALLIARGAQALRAGEVDRAGVLAPAEAFDARTLVERAAPFLRVESVEPLPAGRE